MTQKPSGHPADRVMRVRLREAVHFPDLSERRALKLSTILHYVARAHFGQWHRKVGGPNFQELTGVFTPLYFVDVEVTDLPVDPMLPLQIRGETFLTKTLDHAGAVDHLTREGRHTVLAPREDEELAEVARARLINVFTRYDPDPIRRRVTTLPESLGLGDVPTRVSELPDLGSLVPAGRRPDFAEPEASVWHYGQTDSNRHVNGMEYLRMMECYVAEALSGAGHDLRRLYFTRARIIYRKPCFRGEGYRRVAWIRGEAPLVVTGAFSKDGDDATGRPAVVVELTVSQHPAGD